MYRSYQVSAILRRENVARLAAPRATLSVKINRSIGYLFVCFLVTTNVSLYTQTRITCKSRLFLDGQLHPRGLLQTRRGANIELATVFEVQQSAQQLLGGVPNIMLETSLCVVLNQVHHV